MNDDLNKKEKTNNAVYWDNLLVDEFSKESDRAAVILASSILDNALETLVRSKLVPVPGDSDGLFDGANAPLGSFSSRINIAYGIGLISGRFSRDLHLIRKIRNSFAHNIHGCTFEDASVRSKIQELLSSSIISKERTKIGVKKFPATSRGDFLACCSWMLFKLRTDIDNLNAFEEGVLEWGYDEKIFTQLLSDHEKDISMKSKKQDFGKKNDTLDKIKTE